MLKRKEINSVTWVPSDCKLSYKNGSRYRFTTNLKNSFKSSTKFSEGSLWSSLTQTGGRWTTISIKMNSDINIYK